eukprot:m.89543 g.89543  ORF g.89543 m.89543 type:complete len:409 (-) comp12898_c0_seq3:553-1779(-)
MIEKTMSSSPSSRRASEGAPSPRTTSRRKSSTLRMSTLRADELQLETIPVPHHSDVRVTTVSFARSHNRLALCYEDGSFVVWELPDQSKGVGVEHRDSKRHTGSCTAVAWNMGDSTVVTSGTDGKVVVSDFGLETKVELSEHTRSVWDVCFSPRSTQFVTASADKTAILWNATRDTPIVQFRLLGHTNAIKKASFDSKGDFVVTCSVDTTARVWNASNGDCVHILAGHHGLVTKAIFSPLNSNFLVTASSDATIKIWAEGECTRTIEEHTGDVNDVDITRDGRFIITCSNDSLVTVLDLKKTELKSFLAHDGPINRVLFSPDGSAYATVGDDCIVGVWCTGSNDLLGKFSKHKDPVHCLDFSGDGKFVATGDSIGMALVWSLQPPSPGMLASGASSSSSSSGSSCTIS